MMTWHSFDHTAPYNSSTLYHSLKRKQFVKLLVCAPTFASTTLRTAARKNNRWFVFPKTTSICLASGATYAKIFFFLFGSLIRKLNYCSIRVCILSLQNNRLCSYDFQTEVTLDSFQCAVPLASKFACKKRNFLSVDFAYTLSII